MNRRRFIKTSSVAGLAGLAGCTATLNNSDDTQEEPDTAFETPYDLLYEHYSRFVASTMPALVHSGVEASGDEFGVRDVQTNVIKENLDADRLARLVDLSAEELQAVTDGEENAVVDAEAKLDRGTSVDDIEESWLLATEDGEWRVVERVNSTTSALLTRPDIEFDFEYEVRPNQLKITPESGDRAKARRLILKGTELKPDDKGRFIHIDGSEYPPNARIEMGKTLEVPVESDQYQVSIVWQSRDESCSCVLATDTGPNYK